MSGGAGKMPKRTSWHGHSNKRCKNPDCKKRVRSHADIGYCNKCVNLHNEEVKRKK